MPNENGLNQIKSVQEVILDDRFLDVMVEYIHLCGYDIILNEFGEQAIIKILVNVNPFRYRAESVNEIIANPPMNRSIKENIDCTGGYTYTSDSSENIIAMDTSLSIFMQWIFTGKLRVKIYTDNDINSLLYITSSKVNSIPDQKVLSSYCNYIDKNQQSKIVIRIEDNNSSTIDDFNHLWDQGIDLHLLMSWKDPRNIEIKI